MKKITHEFKAGDWVDTQRLDTPQKTILFNFIKSKLVGSTSDIYSYPVVLFLEGNFRLCSSQSVLGNCEELTWAQLTAPLEHKPFTHDMIRDWLDGTEFTGAIDARMSELQEAVSKFDLAEIEAMDRLENKGQVKKVSGVSDGFRVILANSIKSVTNTEGKFKVVIEARKLIEAQYLHRELMEMAQLTERHDQEIDSVDNYNDALVNIKQGLCEEAMKKVPIGYQEDQPYAPQVGGGV